MHPLPDLQLCESEESLGDYAGLLCARACTLGPWEGRV
jgi:hypothetical protein